MASHDEIPPLSPDVASLLRKARESATPPAEVAKRVWDGTAARIDGPGPGPGGGEVASGAAGSAGSAASALSWLSRPVRLAVLASFAAGVITGSTVVSIGRDEKPEVVSVKVPGPVVTERIVITATPLPVATPAVLVPGDPRALVQLSEATLVLKAHAAVERGDWDYAALGLDAASSRFPDGDLMEERDYLTIRVLLGRYDASAESAIRAFRLRYPGSKFEGQIEAARQP